MAVAGGALADTLARPIRDLRVSVTDRCQFRCTYCMPREVFGRDYAFLPRDQLLTFEELARVARIFARLGVSKLRLTGGEPLLRRDLDRLVAIIPPGLGCGDCSAGLAIAAGETLILPATWSRGLSITGAAPAGNAVGRCRLALVA